MAHITLEAAVAGERYYALTGPRSGATLKNIGATGDVALQMGITFPSTRKMSEGHSDGQIRGQGTAR